VQRKASVLYFCHGHQSFIHLFFNSTKLWTYLAYVLKIGKHGRVLTPLIKVPLARKGKKTKNRPQWKKKKKNLVSDILYLIIPNV